MRAAVPEALSVGLPGGDPAACLARLRHHWALDTWRSTPSTSEDTLRTQMYRERAARKVFRKELRHLRLSAFLTELNLRVELRAPAPGDEMARVAQVTARTNQASAARPHRSPPPPRPHPSPHPALTRRTA